MEDRRTGWAAGIAERARAYWTPERTEALLEGKQLILQPAEAAPLLRAIGLLDRDAKLSPAHVRKYRQINHMVMLLGPALAELRAQHAKVYLLDAGCGRSYLSLLLAWCGRHVWQHPLEILGVDRNAAVVEECRRRAALVELDDVIRFEASPLGDLDVQSAWARAFGPDPARRVHGVVALHACDTATCDALALGVALGSTLLAVAPCCQAELARGWSKLGATSADGEALTPHTGEHTAFASVWRTPHLRRELGANVTDTMRVLLLRAAGYDTTAMEFVPVEHTRKNTLIRALHRGAPDAAARAEYEALVAGTGGVGLALAARLDEGARGG